MNASTNPDNLQKNAVGELSIQEHSTENLFNHIAIWLPDGSIIGPDEFKLASFEGQESVSQPFSFQLQLHAYTASDNNSVYDFDDIIGRPVTAGINMPGVGDNSDDMFKQAIDGTEIDNMSLFNGIVASFAMAEPGVYNLTMNPALWKLTLTNNYCIHPRGCIKDTITHILDKYRIAYDVSSLSDSSNPACNRQQEWLQAGESDYDFIHRLMEKAQLYYYFVHTGIKHTVVFSNHANYPQVYPEGEMLRYTQTTEDSLGLEMEYVIAQYQYQKNLTSSSVNAVFCTAECASEKDTVASYTPYRAKPNTDVKGELPFNFYRIYPYGGSSQEVETHSTKQDQMLKTSCSNLSGNSHCARFRAGYQFKMTNEGMNSDAMPVRPSLDRQAFVLTSVKHTCSLDGTYTNQFQSTEANNTALITPFEIRNTHQGSVLARVVAVDGGSNPNDWRYYDKNVFSPNEYSLKDSTSSATTQQYQGVYVVFSTDPSATAVWVRLAPHMQQVPEVNCIVVVSRSNDEGEIPEIQSIVQNNGTMTVTPSTWTANTHYGNQYSTSFSDSKNLRFPYAKGDELQTGISVVDTRYANGSALASDKFSGAGQFKDVGYSVGAGYNYSIAVNGRGDILNEGESIGCTYNKSDGEETKSWTTYDLVWSESIHDTVKNYQTINTLQYSESTIQEAESTTHILGKNTNEQTVDGETTTTTTHNGSVLNTSTFNAKLTNNTTHDGAVESDTTHEGQVDSTTTHNASVTSNTTFNSSVSNTTTHNANVTNTTNLLGIQTNMTLGIDSSSISVLAISGNNNAIGLSTSLGVTGVHSGVSATGVSSDVSVTGVRTGLSVVASDSMASVTAVDFSAQVSVSGSPLRLTPADFDVKTTGVFGKILVGIQSVL